MNSHLKDNRLTCKLLCLIIFREGYIDILCFFNSHAQNLFFKARNKASASNYERVCFSLTAFECNTFLEAFKVNHSSISVFNLAFFFHYEIRKTLLQTCDFLFNIRIAYFNSFLCDIQALVCSQLHLRLYCYVEFECYLILIDAFDIQCRTGNHPQIMFLDSCT